MSFKRIAFAIALVPAFLACRDGVGPAPSLDQHAPQHLNWARPPQFSVGGPAVTNGGETLDQPQLPGFATSSTGSTYIYYVSFRAKRGVDRGVMLYYREQNLLDVWSQSGAQPWYATGAQHSIAERWFKTWPQHFSSYVIS